MTYYGGKELAAAFRTVRGNTIKIAEEIPEDKYSFRPAEGTRSVAELLAHIAFGSRFQEEVTLAGRKNMDGFDFPKFMAGLAAEQRKPRTKAELIALLTERRDSLAQKLESLSEDFLAESVTFPEGANPPSRTRFDLLLSVKEHEMHHRGQLMLIQRMLGIKPHLTREAEARMAAMQAQAGGGQKQ
jgi:uncharacterized damage-inducible protein DinB